MDFDDSFSTITEAYVDLDIDIEDTDPEIAKLTPEEIREISNVLEKDKTLRREERLRRRKIEESIDEKIVEVGLKNIDDGEKYCLCCGEKFTIIINPRRDCSECKKGICNGCTAIMFQDERICYLCYLKTCKDLKTGKWFAVTSKLNGRFRRNPTAVLVNSMRKLKSKPPPPPIPNGSLVSKGSIASKVSNETIGSISSSLKSMGSKHIPIYVRKDESLNPMKKEINGVLNPPKENPVDVVDFTENRNEDKLKTETLETQPKLQPNSHYLHPTNLETLKNMSHSSNSIYSETFDSYKSGLVVSGDVLFSVFYDDSNSSLNIYVDQCRNLAVADRNKRQTNPYIKTYLLPDKTKTSKKKSTSKKSNVNPIFKETLTYYVPKESLSARTLSVGVWHNRLLTYNYFLGEVHVLLADMDLSKNEPIWYPLQEKMRYPNRSGGHIYKGELIIKLKYKPSTRRDGKGSLHVLIVEAQQLESEGQSLNVYVKGFLLPDRSNKGKKKTPVQKSSTNIRWESLLQFSDVTLEELKDRSLELSVYHYRRLKSNEFLGGVRLNLGLGLHHSDHVSWMDAQGKEKTTWENFLSNPNEYTEAILDLRPNLEYY